MRQHSTRRKSFIDCGMQQSGPRISGSTISFTWRIIISVARFGNINTHFYKKPMCTNTVVLFVPWALKQKTRHYTMFERFGSQPIGTCVLGIIYTNCFSAYLNTISLWGQNSPFFCSCNHKNKKFAKCSIFYLIEFDYFFLNIVIFLLDTYSKICSLKQQQVISWCKCSQIHKL